MSTNVPRSGRARRTSLETNFISGENAAHAVRDVPAGKGGAADVGDAGVQSKKRTWRFADKLFAQIRIANFAAITLPVIQNFDLLNRSLRRKRDGIINHQMFADNVIDNEETPQLPVLRRTPNFLATKQLLLPAGSFDRPNL